MPSEAEDQKPPVCDYEGSDYQTSFWDLGDRAYEDQVEAVALRRLLPPAGDLLLEVGAGAGRNTPRYQGFKRIVLLDYSRTQLQQAQDRLGRAGRYIYVAADVYRLPFVPGLFDTITMIRVLHHMADARRALAGLRRVLRPDGILVLEYASKHHLKAILRHTLGRQDWSPYTHEPVEFAPLNFDFHPAAIRQWLQRGRFSPRAAADRIPFSDRVSQTLGPPADPGRAGQPGPMDRGLVAAYPKRVHPLPGRFQRPDRRARRLFPVPGLQRQPGASPG